MKLTYTPIPSTLPFRRLALLGGLLFAGSALSQAAPSMEIQCNPEDRSIVSCTPDASTYADFEELQSLVRAQLVPYAAEGFTPSDVQIVFVGKAAVRNNPGDVAEGQVLDGNPRNPGNARTNEAKGFRGIKPGSDNEFLLLPAVQKIREAAHTQMTQSGQTRPSTGRMGTSAGDSPDAPTRAGVAPRSFSGGSDSRVRRQPTSSFPWRTIADMGGCTGTFVGPRHVVTAAHCLYNRTSRAWGTNITVRPGRDAGSIPYASTLPPGPGETGWYFTPAQWRDVSPPGGASQYDFGIIVVPDRLGDEIGWMGYGTLNSGTLAAGSPHLLRGYPFCESETNGTGERIDEIDSAELNTGRTCINNALYGGNSCSVQTFSKPDASGWNRRVTHSCDASAANSGAALYSYQEGFGAFVSMIHTTSLACAFPGDAACTSADTHPLQATRITPEYAQWISYFRSLFP